MSNSDKRPYPLTSRPLIITTGDEDGVGLEVTCKALKDRRSHLNSQVIIVRGSKSQKQFNFEKLCKGRISFLKMTSTSLLKTLQEIKDSEILVPAKEKQAAKVIEVVSLQSPVEWIYESARFCLANRKWILGTGPISKTLIQSTGSKALGHTGILKEVCKTADLRMGFFGERFCVVLATDHIPLSKVESALRPESLKVSFKLLQEAKKLLPKAHQKLPITVLGLNPHAGEEGLLGNFEMECLAPMLKQQRGLKARLLPADSAFSTENLRQSQLFLAMYHDQGLIPFKCMHGFSGIHVTLGLPFVRLSVDHGTAKELWGCDQANPQSMISVLQKFIDMNSILN